MGLGTAPADLALQGEAQTLLARLTRRPDPSRTIREVAPDYFGEIIRTRWLQRSFSGMISWLAPKARPHEVGPRGR